MSSENVKLTMNIDENDFVMYGFLKEKLEIKNNLELFTMAALFGKFIVGKREKINKIRSYFRINDTINKNEMVILKCLAICEDDDFNILTSLNDIFFICEEYAHAGIKELYDCYANSGIDFNVALARELMEEYDKVK